MRYNIKEFIAACKNAGLTVTKTGYSDSYYISYKIRSRIYGLVYVVFDLIGGVESIRYEVVRAADKSKYEILINNAAIEVLKAFENSIIS